MRRQLDEQEWVWREITLAGGGAGARLPHCLCLPHFIIFPWELDKERADRWLCVVELVRKREQKNIQTHTVGCCLCQIRVRPVYLLVLVTILCGRLLFYFKNNTEP